MSTGLGVFFTHSHKPLLLDLRMDASRGLCSRTKENMDAANNQLGRSIQRYERIYSHLANSVNVLA